MEVRRLGVYVFCLNVLYDEILKYIRYICRGTVDDQDDLWSVHYKEALTYWSNTKSEIKCVLELSSHQNIIIIIITYDECTNCKSNAFPNADQPVGGRLAGDGVTLGKIWEETGAGAFKSGAEEGGEGAFSQKTTEGATGQETSRPICSL